MVNMPPRFQLIVGVELELEYNRDMLGSLDPASYHDGNQCDSGLGKYFVIEDDSSLDEVAFANGGTAEIISVPFLINDYKKVLKDFQKNIIDYVAYKKGVPRSEVEDTELNDILCFNRTTGAHVHISIVDTSKKTAVSNFTFRDFASSIPGKYVNIRDLLNHNVVTRFREILIRRMGNALSNDVFIQWSNGLDRNYSKYHMSEESIDDNRKGSNSKDYEWNCRRSCSSVEYRSFNLHGIETWDDFFKVWKVLFSTMVRVLAGELKKNKPFMSIRTENIDMDDKKSKKRRRYELPLEPAVKNIRTDDILLEVVRNVQY